LLTALAGGGALSSAPPPEKKYSRRASFILGLIFNSGIGLSIKPFSNIQINNKLVFVRR
jgi:hypothetical protein